MLAFLSTAEVAQFGDDGIDQLVFARGALRDMEAELRGSRRVQPL